MSRIVIYRHLWHLALNKSLFLIFQSFEKRKVLLSTDTCLRAIDKFEDAQLIKKIQLSKQKRSSKWKFTFCLGHKVFRACPLPRTTQAILLAFMTTSLLLSLVPKDTLPIRHTHAVADGEKKENKCNILLFPSFVYMSSSLGLRQVLIWAMALKIGGSAARRILPEIIIISLKKRA